MRHRQSRDGEQAQFPEAPGGFLSPVALHRPEHVPAAVSASCRRHFQGLTERHLVRAIRGHCGYYGLTGNSKRLSGFRYWVIRHWRKALARRSRKGRVTWDRMKGILDRYPLPPATVVYSIYAT